MLGLREGEGSGDGRALAEAIHAPAGHERARHPG